MCAGEDGVPDPLFLDVLDRLVSVQDLEDDLTFQLLEGVQADFPGHGFSGAETRAEGHSMTERPWAVRELRVPWNSPTCFKVRLLLFHQQLLGLFFFPLFDCVTLLGRRKPQEAAPQLDSRLPEPHAPRGAFPRSPTAACGVCLSQKHISGLRSCQRLL